MFDAQYLFEGDSVFSPWMSRGGDNLIVSVDVAAVDGTGAGIYIEVFHKNTEDPGDGTLIASPVISETTTGRADAEYLGLEELVRYRFSAPSGAAAGSRVLYRMLQPIWFDDLNASGAS